MGGIIRRFSFRSSSIIFVVEGSFLRSNDVLDQVISRLISNIRVFFQENRVLGDLVGYLVFGILDISQTVGKVGIYGTGWGSFGITISMNCGSRMVRSRVMGGVVGGGMGNVGVSRKGHGHDSDGSDL